MKKIIYLFLCAIASTSIMGQGITSSGEGQNSILMRGSSLSFDLGKTEIAFGLNNLNNTVGENHKEFYGISLSGKNEEGLANWFSKGDIVPETNFNGYLGYSFSNAVFPQIESRRRELHKKSERIDKRAENMYRNDLPKAIKTYTKKSSQQKLQKDLLNAITNTSMIDFKLLLAESDNDNADEKNAKTQILKEIELIENYIDSKSTKITEELNKLNSENSKNNYWQLYLYGFGGVNAMSFKKFNSLDSTNFSNSFSTENFHGGNAGFGANFQFNSLIFGATYQYIYGNSFDLLDKKEYTIKTVNTNSTQTISSEKKITGYSGDYSIVEQNKFNFDMIYNLLLEKDGGNHILINPYYRVITHSNKSKLIPHTMDAGLGLYFFNDDNKFIGGIYAELPDLENKMERLKPEADQNLRSPFKRGTIGLVTKFSINSMLKLF